MEINSTKFIEIMNKNFGYPVVESDLGKGVEMDCMTAFIYSNVTGAGYLDNHLFPFTTRGLTKVFNKALDYNLINGLFVDGHLKHTPYQLSKDRPFLFDSDKIVIPIEFKTERELQEKLKDFVNKTDLPTNYLIQRIEPKKGHGMEPFMEYLACEAMKKRNFIVENQIPIEHGIGSPDFGGYKVRLDHKNQFSAIHLIELSLLRLGRKIRTSRISDNETIVGEAKTGTSTMHGQLRKYLRTGWFNKGYEIHPKKSKPHEKSDGMVCLSKEYEIVVKEPEEANPYFNGKKQKEYIDWLKNYFKFYLIANLTDDEFRVLYELKMNREIKNNNDIVDFIKHLSIEEILEIVQKVGENGSI